MIRYAQMALAAATLVAAVPAQAADFIIDTAATKAMTSGYGNTFTYSVLSTDRKSTVNVKATAWVRDFNGNYSAGQLYSWGSAGLGIYQAGESGTNYHTIDNANGWEFVVLQFDQAVSLQSAVLNPYILGTNKTSDNDAFIARGTMNYASAVTGAALKNLEAGLNYDPTKQAGATWFNSNSADYNGSATQTYNLATSKAGNLWIVGGSFNGPDGTNDAFKLNTIKVTSGVPEPTTWMTMILGFGMIGAAIRRRRGAGQAVAA